MALGPVETRGLRSTRVLRAPSYVGGEGRGRGRCRPAQGRLMTTTMMTLMMMMMAWRLMDEAGREQ